MKDRPNNGLIDYELQQKMNEKQMNRGPLVNEFEIDIAGLSVGDVFRKAIEIIDTAQILQNYDYVKPKKEMFYSWVFSNGLR